MRSGYLVNAIGRQTGEQEVVVYAGKRRYSPRVARASSTAGTEGFTGARFAQWWSCASGC